MDVVIYTEGLRLTGSTLSEQALGGSETAFISVAREMARQGHTVTAYCLCTSEGIYDGVSYKDVSKINELQHRACDLFICSRFFHIFSQDFRAKVNFLWMHDVLMPGAANYLRHFLPKIAVVYCLSEYHRRLVLQTLPQLETCLYTTMNGLDLSLIDEAVATVAGKKHKIMFTSRPERGLWRALDLYESLNDNSLEFLICTYPSLSDDAVEAYAARCQQRIAALVERGFPVRTGSFVKRELYRQIAESKAVLYPTDFPEVFCISAIEAQACGTVMLATDEFALKETVGYKGVPLGDMPEFSRRLKAILADDDLRHELEARGREHARPYTWENVARTFMAEAERRLAARPAVKNIHFQSFNRIGERSPRYAAYMARRQSAQADFGVAAKIPEVARLSRDITVDYLNRRASWDEKKSLAQASADTQSLPKISCLTATLNRLALLKQSIRCYCDQTYPNRELVIITEGNERYQQAITDYVRQLDRNDIRTIFLKGDYTLGQIRNISMEAANGDIICQWDDDDYNHPDRLLVQTRHMMKEKAQVCFLTDHLQYFRPERAVFWIDWTAGGFPENRWQLVPGTLMMYRDSRFRYPETGQDSSQGEDTVFLSMLCDALRVARLQGMGALYLYTYHGRNTFSQEHHQGLRVNSTSIAHIHQHERLLKEVLSYYQLPAPYVVNGREGTVFTFSP